MGNSNSSPSVDEPKPQTSSKSIKRPTRQNKLDFRKGRVHISYINRERVINAWCSSQHYYAGDLVHIGMISDNTAIEFWSVCMKNHVSSNKTMPNKHATFNDLVLEIIPVLQTYLIPQIAQIVIDYVYLPNEYWWNGCDSAITNWNKQKRFYNDNNNNNQLITRSCGKLVCLESTYQCKECYYGLQHGNDEILNNKSGVIIKLDKKQIIHNIGNKQIYDCLNDIHLQKGIKSEYHRKQIRNLLWRNFNDSMTPLIEALLSSNPNQHRFIKKFKIPNINTDNIHIWSLFDKNKTEVLCALIWREIRDELKSSYTSDSQQYKGDRLIMFEVLFLSTSEHVRHQKIGNEMVRRMEVFARSNCYDILSVAAVPNQGISFWTQNGFEMFVEANSPPIEYDKNIIFVTKRNRIRQFVQHNMLVFNDTPLLIKTLC